VVLSLAPSLIRQESGALEFSDEKNVTSQKDIVFISQSAGTFNPGA
jgi:hypothetical protein